MIYEDTANRFLLNRDFIMESFKREGKRGS